MAQPQQLHQPFQTTCAVPSGEAHVVVVGVVALDTSVLDAVALGAVGGGAFVRSAMPGGRR